MLVKRKPQPEPTSNCFIQLTKHKVALVDSDHYPFLKKYYWRAVKSKHNWYAQRREIRAGRTVTVRMHRQIAKTPPGQHCHHENHNSLDNRLVNLSNMPPDQHYFIHGWR